MDAGNGVVITFGAFQDWAGADASTRMAADWVKDNLASLLPNPPEVTVGEIKVRTLRAVAAAAMR